MIANLEEWSEKHAISLAKTLAFDIHERAIKTNPNYQPPVIEFNKEIIKAKIKESYYSGYLDGQDES